MEQVMNAPPVRKQPAATAGLYDRSLSWFDPSLDLFFVQKTTTKKKVWRYRDSSPGQTDHNRLC